MDCTHTKKECKYYMTDYHVGFRILNPKQGECYAGRNYRSHNLVFMLEGDIEFSYNEFLNQSFTKDDIFLLPQAVEMHGRAITDAKMLILSFNNRVKTLCDNCCLSDYSEDTGMNVPEFKSLKMNSTLLLYMKLIEVYINKGIRCGFLHELKQKELFLVMRRSYPREELSAFFNPIVGKDIDFKFVVLENYREHISIQELAAKLGMSYSSFLRKFKAEFGDSAQEWMLKQKAKHIRLKLSIPSTTIADIVRDFGFSDASHFTRYSNKYFGRTPLKLMKELREKKSVSE